MIAVIIVAAVVFIYVLGRSDGKEKIRKDIRDLFDDTKRKGRR